MSQEFPENYGPFGGGTGPGGSFTGHDKLLIPLPAFSPDNFTFTPKPVNEKTLGLSSEPDRDLGTEVEI
jgi:hypothetical protein